MSQRQRNVLRVEIATCLGCAIIGAAFQLGGTLRGMSIFLFGWSLGCVFHLTQMLIARRISRHKRRP